MTTYIRKEGLEVIELDGNWIILNALEFKVTTLNEVGGFCWSLLSEECTIQQIIQVLQNHYEIENECIEQDIEGFVAHLLDCGLVRNAS
jgi:hypothetical protein